MVASYKMPAVKTWFGTPDSTLNNRKVDCAMYFL